jgi:hypothetical protein
VTALITVLAGVAVLGAAARSTWSPCGLSMLSTITPLSERAKGHSYRTTATWFIVGATVGGAFLGSVMALGAVGVRSLHLSGMALATVALATALIAAVSDSGVVGLRVPIHRRQVNERWLDHYRPWVYGAGFGWQIGTGVATYITSACIYLVIVLGALTTVPLAAFLLGTLFGLLRGFAVLLTRNQTSPAGLRAFHRAFAAAGPKVARLVVGLEIALSVVLAAAVGSSTAITLVVVAAVAAAGGVVVRHFAPAGGPAVDSEEQTVGAAINGTGEPLTSS